MNWRMALAILVVLGWASFEVYTVYRSRHLFEPLATFDRFASMHHAARACGEFDPEVRERFALNLDAVRSKAARHLAGAHPDQSEAAIERKVVERDRERAREIDDLVAAQGCDGRDLWHWLKLYEQRARLRIRDTG